eukprot:TRINITY_DN5789_c0_g1_i3.p4 TRINITY_DN5789_c0_g1~~TRINITY_DN5789_c0_g1_i3.p4  ORF type:complete len:106 (-),score=5.43 TRINITY_DN5789_c0_g1_i3:152-469(-)
MMWSTNRGRYKQDEDVTDLLVHMYIFDNVYFVGIRGVISLSFCMKVLELSWLVQCGVCHLFQFLFWFQIALLLGCICRKKFCIKVGQKRGIRKLVAFQAWKQRRQ